ncbi:MAG: hypothetical protein LBO06_00675 [Bacteroidales bacterium]|jgi:hypothetical protein|nr:hypothetical protein [Bacteroidales bacterium]
MKKLMLVALLAFSTLSYGQTNKGWYADYAIQFSFISHTDGIDNYFKQVYPDYKSGGFLNGSFGISVGYKIVPQKFGVAVDIFANGGSPFSNYKREQSKSLSSGMIAIVAEYSFLNKEYWSLSAKVGIGTEGMNFFYSRKEPIDMFAAEFYNVYIPVGLTFWIHSSSEARHALGLYAQYNIPVVKGKAYVKGVDAKLEGVPNVMSNSLAIGIKGRISKR